MNVRMLCLLAAVASVGACATKSEEADAVSLSPRDTAMTRMNPRDSARARTDSLRMAGDSTHIRGDSARRDTTGMTLNR